jgi:hypothetical protein
VTAYNQYQKQMQERVLPLWPDRLPEELANKTRGELEQLMEEVAEFVGKKESELPEGMGPLHRMLVEQGRERYQRFLQMGSEGIQMREVMAEPNFLEWLSTKFSAEGRAQIELAMQAVQESN